MDNAIGKKCEIWLKKVQRKNMISPLSIILFFISQFYRLAIEVRNFFYDKKLFPIATVDIPVISVGNIVAGGVGKTSFISLLTNDLSEKVGILSRGYRAEVKLKSQIVKNVAEGDEAFMLSKRHQNAVVIVGKNRIQSASLAIEKGAKCILLDDGMQHRKIFRDVEIVVLHADNIFGFGQFLPKGMLRDSPKRLKKADWIILHGVKNEGHFQQLKKQIKLFTSAPIMGTKYVIENGEKIKKETIGAFCAIGSPETFYQMLEEMGCTIVDRKTLPDHQAFNEALRFVKECKEKGANKIICTEKDYIKLKDLKDIIPLKVRMEVQFGLHHYQNLLSQIRSLITSNKEEYL